VRRGRLVACVCLLGIFAAALITSLDYSLMDALGPGPGFFPFWLSLLGATLTVAILVETARSHDIGTASILLSRQDPRTVHRKIAANLARDVRRRFLDLLHAAYMSRAVVRRCRRPRWFAAAPAAQGA
jgi:hypothetical protein